MVHESRVHAEDLQREADFAGEFGEVRRTGLAVDADKLISGSSDKKPLSGIRLFNGLEEEVSEQSRKKQKVGSPDAPEAVYHLDLDDDEDDYDDDDEQSRLIKLTKIQDEDESFVDDDTQPRLINMNTLSFLKKTTSDENPARHLNSDDEDEVKETHLNSQPGLKGEPISVVENDNDDDNDEFFDAQDQTPDIQTLRVENEVPPAKGISEVDIVNLKVKLYSKLTGRSHERPYGLESKFQDIYSLLESAVIERESQSALVIGAKNSGKTACLNAALEQLRSKIHKTQDDFLLVKISGITQEDDNSAVKSIARQLDSELSRVYHVNIRKLDDADLLARNSVTETFANILSILDKHILNEDDDKKLIKIPIIFVIDEVDVYASPNRQILLYNLFDLVENSSTPITTLCFSSKFTVKDMFEKRVRSRFSQRMIQFPKLPMGQFVSVAQKILSIDDPQNDYEKKWNESIEKLISNDTALRRTVVNNHLTVNNFKDFHNHCTYPLSKISPAQPFINDKDFNKYASNHNNSSLQKIVNSLSEIEISLLISAARLVTKNDLNWINLNTAYEEYQTQANAQNKIRSSTVFNVNSISAGFKVWSKERCEEPWTVLQKLGLLTPPNNGAKSGKSVDFSNNTVETKMWQLEITLDELRFIVNSDKNVKSWTRL